MLKNPVVLLVGGPDTGKTKFYSHYTKAYFYHPTKHIKAGIRIVSPGMVLVDTPGAKENRDSTYCWRSFCDADLIVTFGNWDISEINGEIPKEIPILSACQTEEDTMKRIVEKLQECYPYSYFS